MHIRHLVAVLAVALLLACGTSTDAAPPAATGTFVTPLGQGTLKYTPLRAVVQYGSEGMYVINGRNYPGSMGTARGSTTLFMVWYYGYTGIPAGSAALTPAGGTSYVGPIAFTDRKGNVINSGTLTVTLP